MKKVITSILGVATALASTLNANAENHFLIINGDRSYQHQLNVYHAQNALFKEGIPNERVVTLSTNNIVPNNKNLSQSLDYIAKNFDSNDTLFVYTTGNGTKNVFGDRLLVLNSEETLSPEKLVSSIKNKLKQPKVVYIGDQCYAGIFANALRDSKLEFVAMTDTDDHTEVRCKHFADEIWSSFEKKEIKTSKQLYDDVSRLNRLEGFNDYQTWHFSFSPGMENFSFKK